MAEDPTLPEFYGVDPESTVAIYLEGELKPEEKSYRYPYGYYHFNYCADAARTWFAKITSERPLVRARELNWNQPYHCEVCEESIT